MRRIFREAPSTAGLAEAEAQLARLRRALRQAADGRGGRLADDAAFKRKASALAIRLLGLQALAARCEAERSAGRGGGVLEAMLEVRGAELRRAALELLVEAAGYYALAAPDGLLLHNEGPIGPDWAAPAVREMLTGLLEPGPQDTAAAYRQLLDNLLG